MRIVTMIFFSLLLLISNSIWSESNLPKSNEKNAIEFYNEEAFIQLFVGEHDKALEGFNYVLECSQADSAADKKVIGAALWGRFFCHAYQGSESEAFEDLNLIYSFFVSNYHLDSPCSPPNELRYPDFSHEQRSAGIHLNNVQLVADLINPKQRISPADCKDRVLGTANLMRLLATKIPDSRLAAAAHFAISELERVCNSCCDKEHWTECLNPIVEAWQYVKRCLANGVKIAPHIIWPGR